jgi:toxin FitB
MNVVDSCGWLEFFADGPNASIFTGPIENTKELIIPSLSIYEVFKRILQQRTEGEALQAIALMEQGHIIELDSRLAVLAAHISIDNHLTMADSIMLSTSIAYNAIFWTQDSHFENIKDIKYIKAKK